MMYRLPLPTTVTFLSLVDKADVDETNSDCIHPEHFRTFEQTEVVPETDALFFAKVAQATEGRGIP